MIYFLLVGLIQLQMERRRYVFVGFFTFTYTIFMLFYLCSSMFETMTIGKGKYGIKSCAALEFHHLSKLFSFSSCSSIRRYNTVLANRLNTNGTISLLLEIGLNRWKLLLFCFLKAIIFQKLSKAVQTGRFSFGLGLILRLMSLARIVPPDEYYISLFV